MADTTKDIWNDDDGEEALQKKSHRFRRFLIFFLVLVVVLVVVLLAAYRDGTGFDVLRRYFTYGETGEESDSGYQYDASSSNRFAVLGERLVVLSNTSLQVLSADGSEVWSTSVKMNTPALAVGGGRAVAYDVGGTELYVVDSEGEQMTLTADPSEPFLAATLNDDGSLAVTAERDNCKGAVDVYSAQGDLMFTFRSSQRFVTDAYVTDDDSYLAAVTLGQEDSVFVSNIVLYDLTETEPVADYDISDGLVLEISQQDNRIVTVSDTVLTLADPKGTVEGSYSSGSMTLPVMISPCCCSIAISPAVWAGWSRWMKRERRSPPWTSVTRWWDCRLRGGTSRCCTSIIWRCTIRTCRPMPRWRIRAMPGIF